MQIAILGRQSKISLAELESLFGSQKITPISNYAAIVDTDTSLPQERLGGTIKSAQILNRLKDTNLDTAFDYLKDFITDSLNDLPEGKLKIGLSLYGFDIKSDILLKKSLQIKKHLKAAGRSVRIVENKVTKLSSAQVLYNKLASPLGFEFLIVKNNDEIILAKTTGIQNIDDYSKRDFGRPKRDAYVGMLPPKLAQIMINLAIGKPMNKDSRSKIKEDDPISTNHQLPPTILDPFCGTGVVLQEALLMDLKVYGSDINPKMVDYSRQNLQWLENKWQTIKGKWQIEEADATKHTWRQPIDVVVTEIYLGQPLSSLPAPDKLQKIADQSNDIAYNFLQNMASQIKSGTKLCLALPAWCLGDEKFLHLKTLDHLRDLGYTRLSFEYAEPKEMIYHRPDQIVARELILLVRN
jgi:tRNA G10  N-methylase Trm11